MSEYDIRCKEREPGWLLGPYYWGRFNFVLSYDDLWRGFCRDRNDGAIYFAPLPGFIFGFVYDKRAPLPSNDQTTRPDSTGPTHTETRGSQEDS